MNVIHPTTFAALADPTRLRIIEMLSDRGELSASQISGEFSMSAPAVSQHLKVLREAGLVHMQKRAQQRIYQLDAKTLAQLEHWLHRRA